MMKKLATLMTLAVLMTGCANVNQTGYTAKTFEFSCHVDNIKVCEADSLKGCACYSTVAMY